jgi:hypothetical protein
MIIFLLLLFIMGTNACTDTLNWYDNNRLTCQDYEQK